MSLFKQQQTVSNNSNLAYAKKLSNGSRESAALLEASRPQPHLYHQVPPTVRTRKNGAITPSSLNLHASSSSVSGPHSIALNGGPTATSTLSNVTLQQQQPQQPKCSRFEQLIKSLVGRKVSRDASTQQAPALTNPSSHQPLLSSPIPQPPPLQPLPAVQPIPSPEILITKSPSERTLLRPQNDKSFVASTASLHTSNSVQQKLWSVLPLLRRENSCSNLKQTKSHNALAHYSGGDGGGVGCGRFCGNGTLKKCDTSLALSQSACNLEPIRPQNRLRNSSWSTISCSRCSSLLSLDGANGSRYSLHLMHGRFVAVGGEIKTSSPSSSLASPPLTPVVQSSSVVTLLTPSGATATSLAPPELPQQLSICKLCLGAVVVDDLTIITQCGCLFCTEVSHEQRIIHTYIHITHTHTYRSHNVTRAINNDAQKMSFNRELIF